MVRSGTEKRREQHGQNLPVEESGRKIPEIQERSGRRDGIDRGKEEVVVDRNRHDRKLRDVEKAKRLGTANNALGPRLPEL
jgi:hypothetical protein